MYNYALYMDTWGIGDQGYYVLQLEKVIKPEEVYVEINFSDGINEKQNEWLKERTILFNYSEAGFHHSEPNIQLLNNRHLVFSRGGYYYSLYDLKLQKDTFNDSSPWHSYRESGTSQSEKFDRQKVGKAFDLWMSKNLSKKIENYIKENK